MSRSGPIILLEDDKEERLLIVEALMKLGIPNQVKHFENGEDVLDYLNSTTDKPFIIISDVGTHLVNGIELKRKINADPYLKEKSIPFIFFTDTAKDAAVEEAFRLSVQGYFLKQPSFAEMQQQLKFIIDYWQECLHPNKK